MEKPLYLNKRDSFMEIRAYQQDDVLISGGQSFTLTGLQRNKTVTKDVPGKCGDVYVDDLRYVKARSPNMAQGVGVNVPHAAGPYHTIKSMLEPTESCNMQTWRHSQNCPPVNKDGFEFANKEIDANWPNLQETEIMVFHSWVAEKVKIKKKYLSKDPTFKGKLKGYPDILFDIMNEL